jgi:hypothetical protein
MTSFPGVLDDPWFQAALERTEELSAAPYPPSGDPWLDAARTRAYRDYDFSTPITETQQQQEARSISEMEPIGVGGRIASAGGAVVRGATSILASLPKAAVGSYAALRHVVDAGGDEDLRDYALWQLGNWMEDTTEAWLPPDPRVRESFFNEVLPQGAGSMAAFMAGGALGQAVKVPTVAVALFGSAAQGTQSYEEAKAFGATEDDSRFAGSIGAIVGLTEIASEPLSALRTLRRLDKASGGAIERAIGRVATETLKSTSIEAGEEIVQQIGSNVAKRVYDEEQPLAEGWAQAGLAGGILGGLAQGIAQGLRRRFGSREQVVPPPVAPPLQPGEVELPPDQRTATFFTPTKPLSEWTKQELLTLEGAEAFTEVHPELAAKIAAIPGKVRDRGLMRNKFAEDRPRLGQFFGQAELTTFRDLLKEVQGAVEEGQVEEGRVGERERVGEVGQAAEAGGGDLVEEGGEVPQVEAQGAAVLEPSAVERSQREHDIARRALDQYKRSRGYGPKASDAVLGADDTYQSLLAVERAAKRSLSASEAAHTRARRKAEPKTGIDAIAEQPVNELPPEVGRTMQEEAAYQLTNAKSEKTKAALQKIIDDAGRDVGAEVKKQKKRLVGILTGEIDQRSIFEKDIGAPRRPADPAIEEFVQTGKVSPKAATEVDPFEFPGPERPAVARPGLFGQETFDPLTGRQGELPIPEGPERPTPDVAGQQTLYGEPGAPSGTAYAPSRPTGEVPPPGESTEATIGAPSPRPGAKYTLHPVSMPELVELSEAMLGQRPRISHRLRRNLGLFKSKEGNPLTEILLNPKAAADPQLLAQVLAHELGHAVDFLPDYTLKRGNILGRIASLRGYLKRHLEAYPGAPGRLTDEDRARIKAEVEALKGETVEREIDEEIEHVTGLTPQDILAVWNAATDVKVNKQVEDYIKTLNNKQKKAIIGQAIKGIIPDELKAFANVVREKTGRTIKITEKVYKDLAGELRRRIEEEVAKHRLYRNEQVREELIGLTAWWSGPFNPRSKYGQYRTSSRELYAEAISVLLRSPRQLEQRAPEFWRGFMAYLDRKPAVRDEYLNLMQLLNGSPKDIAENRTARVVAQYDRAEQQVRAVDASNEAGRQSTWAGVTETLFGHLVDRHAAIANRAGAAKAKGVAVDKADNAVYLMDELNDTDKDMRELAQRTDREILQPILADGMTTDDIGEYLQMHRVIEETDDLGGDRFDVANPLGFDPDSARSQIEAMIARLGESKYLRLHYFMREWHNLIFKLAENAVRSGVYSRKAFEETIRPNKHKYSTWAVVKHYQGKISSGLRQQLGTFDDIINPFTATMMKMVTLNRMNRLNEAKTGVIDFLRTAFPAEVKEVKIPYKEREPTTPAPPGFDYLIVLEDGQPHAYQVPENIARMYKSHDVGSAAMLTRIMGSEVYKRFHPLYVTFSPGFVAANALFRDPGRTFVNLPAAVKLHAPGKKVRWRDMVLEYLRAAPVAWKAAWDIDDPLLKRMEQEGTLKGLWTRFDRRAAGYEETKLQRLLEEFGVNTPEEAQKTILGVFRTFLRLIERMGVFGERLTNIAAAQSLEKAGVPLRERRFIVKKYAGTPDVLQRGWANPVTNSIFMYWKVHVNGMQADARLATSPQSAADWWFRRFTWTFVPKLLTFAATAGLLGEYLKSLYADIPDEAKQNGTPISFGRVPHKGKGLGRNKDGKTVYINAVQDDMGRFLGSLVWHGLQAAYPLDERPHSERTTMALADLFGHLVPGRNPILEISRVWAEYGMGRNPYDPFLGRDILSRTEEKAGGSAAAEKMLWWTSQKFGVVSTAANFLTRELRGKSIEESEETVLEVAAETFAGFQRIIKITDRGLSEAMWTAVENEDQEDAQFLASLPVDVRRATNYRYMLNRRAKVDLTVDQKRDKRRLNGWYADIYAPRTKAIKAAEKRGDEATAERLRSSLETSAVKQGR